MGAAPGNENAGVLALAPQENAGALDAAAVVGAAAAKANGCAGAGCTGADCAGVVPFACWAV